MRLLPMLGGLVLLSACASDDSTPPRHHGKHGPHFLNAPSGTPSPHVPKPVYVPPGTVTNSPELRPGAVDAMGTPSD